MAFSVSRIAALVCAVFVAGAPIAAIAQSQDNDPKAAEARAAGQRKIDEIVEISRSMTGPASNYECVWHGTRIVSLLWNDDIDTALRQLEIYDRYNCPGAHIQATFRCLFQRQPSSDPKTPNPINKLVSECWKNPGASPATASSTSSTPQRGGTSNR